MKASEGFSDELVAFLKSIGFSEEETLKMNVDTRLYHDLKFDGDTAEEIISKLALDHGIDMSGFDFDCYFPREFPGSNTVISVLFSLIPFWRYLHKKSRFYQPLTLSMMDEAVRTKHWQS